MRHPRRSWRITARKLAITQRPSGIG
jgi:hypothetical protein